MPKQKLDSLTEPMFYTLIALQKERCGIEITNFVITITHDRVRLGPGTLYTMLSKFLEEDMIQETRMDGRKRYYQISEKGQEMLAAEYQRLTIMLLESKPYMEGSK